MVVQNFETDPNVITLAESVMNKKCVIFFGAGVSCSAGFPNWTELIQRMRRQANLNTEMDYGGHLRCADYCKKILGNDFFTFMSKEFRRNPAFLEKDPHLLLAKLPCKIYITTNYDTRMESALEKVRNGEQVEVISSDRDIWTKEPGINDDYIWVIKMHGCIKKNLQDIVIGESDYLEYEQKYRKMFDLVTRIIQEYNVLFLGYSISDWNMSKILYQCREHSAHNKYFLHIGNDSNMNATISRLISLYNIKPVIRTCKDEEKNECLTDFLERLRELYMIPEWMGKIIDSLLGFKVAEKYNRRSRLSEIFYSLEVTNIVRFLYKVEQETKVNLDIPQILKEADNYTIADILRKMKQ